MIGTCHEEFTMKPQLVFAAFFALIAPAALAADGNFDRTLSVGAAPSLTISAGSGYIHVSSVSSNQIHIIGHVHVRSGWISSGGDEDRVKQIIANPPIQQSGDTITIGGHTDSDLFRNISIDFEITTPHGSSVKASEGSGSVQISGIEGMVSAQSGSGDIRVENIGSAVRLNTGSGSVTANNVGANAHMETASGSIHATGVRGAATLHTSSGGLELSLTAPGDVDVGTSSGSIRVTGLSGGLHAGSSSGSIEVAGNPSADWRIGTSSGGVRLSPDPAAHFSVDADTGSGSIHVDRPIVMQGDLNRHHVNGTVNGGGPTIHISTSSGSVSIH